MEPFRQDFSDEFVFQTSRSSGPGGQNVNKVSSKVELRFHIGNSKLLSEAEKMRLIEKLDNKINREGELIIIAQTDRSQLKNKEKAIEKFYHLLDKALKKPKDRIETKPTKNSIEKRLESKRLTALTKASRKGVDL